MSNIEQFAEVIASKISKKITMDHDEEEVIAYGAFILIQTILSIALVVIFGIIFNVLTEAIIISFSAAILRKFSGGAHANSPINCALIGMIIFGLIALMVKHYIININFLYLIVGIFISFTFTYYILDKYSPVGTATKPLKNENTRNRLKKNSLKLILCLFVANIFLILIYLQTKQIQLLNIAICITAGVLWQTITMISLGHKIIYIMDKVFGGINIFIRRTN